MFDFGPVLLERTLDADTSEHHLQSDMTTVTPRDMLPDHNWALPSFQGQAGQGGQGGLAIEAWQRYERAGCDGHSEMNAD